MKKSVILSLFVIMICFTSCWLFPGVDPPDTNSIGYHIYFSFKDASGNDLVNGIELNSTNTSGEQPSSGVVSSELYHYDILFSEACENASNLNPPFSYSDPPQLKMERINSICWLSGFTDIDPDDCPEEKIVTYTLKCPYIFGDWEIHKIVTYWDLPPTRE